MLRRDCTSELDEAVYACFRRGQKAVEERRRPLRLVATAQRHRNEIRAAVRRLQHTPLTWVVKRWTARG